MPSRSAGYVGRNGICYAGPAWQPAPTRKFSTCFAGALRRTCLHISEPVIPGGHGFPPPYAEIIETIFHIGDGYKISA